MDEDVEGLPPVLSAAANGRWTDSSPASGARMTSAVSELAYVRVAGRNCTGDQEGQQRSRDQRNGKTGTIRPPPGGLSRAYQTTRDVNAL